MRGRRAVAPHVGAIVKDGVTGMDVFHSLHTALPLFITAFLWWDGRRLAALLPRRVARHSGVHRVPSLSLRRRRAGEDAAGGGNGLAVYAKGSLKTLILGFQALPFLARRGQDLSCSVS